MVACLVLGFTAFRRRGIAVHRAWMIRAYAIGLAAGTQAFTEGGAVFGAGELHGDLAKGAGWSSTSPRRNGSSAASHQAAGSVLPVRGLDRDHDLSADLALLEQPHGIGCFVERIAPVHARDDLAVFDEAGEPFEVGGALFRHEQHQTLPQEG